MIKVKEFGLNFKDQRIEGKITCTCGKKLSFYIPASEIQNMMDLTFDLKRRLEGEKDEK
jgi:hypothetical protein